MTVESMIGIISGVFGIAGGIVMVIKGIPWLIEKCKGPSPQKLFAKILDNKLSDKTHRDILMELNKSSLIAKRIKDEYIQNFTLGKRGKESVFFDLCDSNDIEPTDDICKGLIGVSMPSLLKTYKEKRKAQIVYMSDLLKERFPETCNRLLQILDKYHVHYEWIKGTKDIWCRDYMPVQTESGKFIQFRYDPSYLKGKKEWEDSRSDVKEICRMNKIDAIFSDINLDGGNVLICDGRAIISDRLFSENPERDKDSLVKELARFLECEIIIIPALKSQEDLTGHADGMVRFVDRDTIIGNERRPNEYKYMKEGLQAAIDKFKLTYIDIPYFEDKDAKHPYSAIGIYVNYLELKDLIILPIFNSTEDQAAVEIIKKTFPNKHIETINYNDIAKEGGLLNCTTWVVNK